MLELLAGYQQERYVAENSNINVWGGKRWKAVLRSSDAAAAARVYPSVEAVAGISCQLLLVWASL